MRNDLRQSRNSVNILYFTVIVRELIWVKDIYPQESLVSATLFVWKTRKWCRKHKEEMDKNFETGEEKWKLTNIPKSCFLWWIVGFFFFFIYIYFYTVSFGFLFPSLVLDFSTNLCVNGLSYILHICIYMIHVCAYISYIYSFFLTTSLWTSLSIPFEYFPPKTLAI